MQKLTPAMRSSYRSSARPVAIWVYTGVIMLIIQVILGGITRLTGSGLSITHWDVVTGALPPLNETEWQHAFDAYKQTPQYHILNSGFTLSDFKSIFFWEWFHRFWARLVGVVFLVGFVWLLLRRRLQRWMIRPLVALFLLGALQGAIGWIMVASGLTGDAIYVEPTRLALHFIFALGLIVYAFWFALLLSVPRDQRLIRLPPRPLTFYESAYAARVAVLRRWSIALLVLLFFQLLYGALMAGHKAAAAAPTWPDINGSWIPDSLFTQRPLARDLIGNRFTVQFIHRTLGYLLFVVVVCWTIAAARISPVPASFRRWRRMPLLLISVQVVLGVCSLLTSPGIIPQHWVAFDWLAQFHQVNGLLFLLLMTGMLYLVIPVRISSV
ncbi:MAG TPA: COX15/CtaA family protein [Puia sp.]|nr:COX15/CtaA family protein [Puia sp.]